MSMDAAFADTGRAGDRFERLLYILLNTSGNLFGCVLLYLVSSLSSYPRFDFVRVTIHGSGLWPQSFLFAVLFVTGLPSAFCPA